MPNLQDEELQLWRSPPEGCSIVVDDEVERIRAILECVHQQPPAGKLKTALRKVTARFKQKKAAVVATERKLRPKKDAA